LTRQIARNVACFAAAAIAIALLHLRGLAYSAGQQLITTAWNVSLAILLVAITFGWAGGMELVAASYARRRSGAPKR
jgi:hypothetical protein